MNSSNKSLCGVGCDVVNCKYHAPSNICSAESINVESRNACKKVETFCGTFAAKQGSAQ